MIILILPITRYIIRQTVRQPNLKLYILILLQWIKIFNISLHLKYYQSNIDLCQTLHSNPVFNGLKKFQKVLTYILNHPFTIRQQKITRGK